MKERPIDGPDTEQHRKPALIDLHDPIGDPRNPNETKITRIEIRDSDGIE
jgi:hypothetical protein